MTPSVDDAISLARAAFVASVVATVLSCVALLAASHPIPSAIYRCQCPR